MSQLIVAIVVMVAVFWVLAGWALRKDRRLHPAADEPPRRQKEVA